MTPSTEDLARGWFAAWTDMDMDRLREILAPDFVHTSPFGRFEDRETYLAAIEPMARKSVQQLTVHEVLVDGDRAAVWFENLTPKGAIPSCDWFRVEAGRIREIRSFYDSVAVREVLTTQEQATLDGGY